MATLCPMLKFREFDANGLPLVGGKVYFWASGTQTAQDVYSNPEGTVALPYPVVLDSSGQATVYLNGIYDGKVTDADDNLMYTFNYAVGGETNISGNSSIFIPAYSTVGQETIGTGVETYTWAGGSIDPDATSFTIGLNQVSLDNTTGTENPYFNESPLASPLSSYDPATNYIYNLGIGVHLYFENGATIDNTHTLFGASTLHMNGLTNNVPPYITPPNDIVWIEIRNEESATAFNISTGQKDFTFQSWVYLDSLPGSSPNSMTLFRDGRVADRELNLEIYLQTDTLNVVCGLADGTYGTPVTGSITWATGQWYFIEVTRASGIAYLFVDGVLLTSGALASSGIYIDNNQRSIGCDPRRSNGQCINVLDGSMSQILFIRGTALHTSGYTVPSSATVFNSGGGSFAMRIITDAGELTSAVYSGYGTNLVQDDWSDMFSESIDGNTYIGCCGQLDAGSYFSGKISVDKGVDNGGGTYIYNVKVDGYIENPLLDGQTQVSASGYFETSDTPVGFKLYTQYTGLDFDSGIASVTQYAGNYVLSGVNGGPFSNHYSSTGTNAYTLTKMDDGLRASSYFNGMEFNFSPANTNDSTTVTVNILGADDAPLGVKSLKMPDGSDPAIGFLESGSFYYCHYDTAAGYAIIDFPSVLTALQVPDGLIDADMLASNSVTTAKILDANVTTAKLADSAVTTAKIADGAITVDKFAVGSGVMVCSYNLGDGVNGGDASTGSWITRPLNVESFNSIGGTSALSGNAITLPAGTYEIQAWGSFYKTRETQMRVQQTSVTASTLLFGIPAYFPSLLSAEVSGNCYVGGVITLAAEETIELQYQVARAQSTNGLGVPSSFAVGEQYANIVIRQINPE